MKKAPKSDKQFQSYMDYYLPDILLAIERFFEQMTFTDSSGGEIGVDVRFALAGKGEKKASWTITVDWEGNQGSRCTVKKNKRSTVWGVPYETVRDGSGVFASTPAHEVGHMLGLEDEAIVFGSNGNLMNSGLPLCGTTADSSMNESWGLSSEALSTFDAIFGSFLDRATRSADNTWSLVWNGLSPTTGGCGGI
jgi:hypothetical protein